MASTGTETNYQAERTARRSGDGYDRGLRQRRGIFISTEARPGFITSEFWFTVIGVAALGILAFASDALGVRWGMGMATAVLLAYVVSRGIAKAGSSDIMARDDDA